MALTPAIIRRRSFWMRMGILSVFIISTLIFYDYMLLSEVNMEIRALPWANVTIFNRPENRRMLSSLDRVFTVLNQESGRDPKVLHALSYILRQQRMGADDKNVLMAVLHNPNQVEHDVFKTPVFPCKARPLDQLGDVKLIGTENTTVEDIEKDFPTMMIGGHWRPADCVAVQKIAIIIPYRNRWGHLIILLQNLIPFIQRQNIDFTIFVIEQIGNTTFNRGMLMNIGFIEANQHAEFDCFIFHDVDMLPIHDANSYTCVDSPRHMPSYISKFHRRGGMPYKTYFGAVVAFTKEQYITVNGNSNFYFGWGGEDDDLIKRVVDSGYTMARTDKSAGRYKMIKHTRDSTNAKNIERNWLLSKGKSRFKSEGLSSTHYVHKATHMTYLYTWVQVDISLDEILDTASNSLKAVLKRLLKSKEEAEREQLRAESEKLKKEEMEMMAKSREKSEDWRKKEKEETLA